MTPDFKILSFDARFRSEFLKIVTPLNPIFALLYAGCERLLVFSSNKRIKLSSSSPCEVSELSQESGTQEGNGPRSEQHSDNNYYQNSRPGSSGKNYLLSTKMNADKIIINKTRNS